MKRKKVCSIWGHKEANPEKKEDIEKLLTYLVLNKDVEIFLFFDFNKFSFLCYDVINKVKQKYPNVKRVFISSDQTVSRIGYKIEHFIFDNYIFKLDKINYSFKDYEIVMKSDFLLIQLVENGKWDRRLQKYTFKFNRKCKLIFI